MTDELTLAILAEIAKPGSGQLFSRREAARHAIAMIEQQAGRIAAAEADAIERCAKVCDEYAADQWSLYKGRPPYNGSEEGRANQRVEGKSDGADACAQAIRALLPKEE